MIEICWGGKRKLELKENKLTRSWIEDGDVIKIEGHCKNDDYIIGFGDCTGLVLPADVI